MIGFSAIAWADGGVDPGGGASQMIACGAGGSYASDECGPRSVL
jgi:hypothetical protein